VKAKETLFWSIAFPGFGQFLNGKYVKGIVLLFLEFLVNIMANFNLIIISSFHGETYKAISQANLQWLMFYPCIYFFAIWDAYKDAGGGTEPYSYLPFAFSAYFVTAGVIFSEKIKVFGVLLGPVWLPMLSVIPGIAAGLVLQKMIIKKWHK
jgi:TM2 domain-containing membrane protein YozV